MMKHLMWYLWSIIKWCLTYRANRNNKVIGYINTDYTIDYQDRKSIIRIVEISGSHKALSGKGVWSGVKITRRRTPYWLPISIYKSISKWSYLESSVDDKGFLSPLVPIYTRLGLSFILMICLHSQHFHWLSKYFI